MRKEAGFEVVDRINVRYTGSELDAVVENNKAELCDTLLADSFEIGETGSYNKELDINGHNMVVYVEKVK